MTQEIKEDAQKREEQLKIFVSQVLLIYSTHHEMEKLDSRCVVVSQSITSQIITYHRGHDNDCRLSK